MLATLETIKAGLVMLSTDDPGQNCRVAVHFVNKDGKTFYGKVRPLGSDDWWMEQFHVADWVGAEIDLAATIRAAAESFSFKTVCHWLRQLNDDMATELAKQVEPPMGVDRHSSVWAAHFRECRDKVYAYLDRFHSGVAA